MARVSYRRRNDGILEIVRPHPWQRLTPALRAAVAVVVLVVAGAAGVGLYVAVGGPFLLFAGCAVLVAVLLKTGKTEQEQGVGVSGDARRSAP
jgi:hypothetical protein